MRLLMTNLVLEPESKQLSYSKNVMMMREFWMKGLRLAAANWHGRHNIGAKLKPEVYTSAELEQGCLVMGGSDTGQAKKTSGLLTKHSIHLNLKALLQMDHILEYI